MARRLPPDEECARLWASGMSQTEIARRFGVSSRSVCAAISKARGRGARSLGRDFVQAGKDPVSHVETKGDVSRLLTGMDGVYRPLPLDLHECNDLLKEWGAI